MAVTRREFLSKTGISAGVAISGYNLGCGENMPTDPTSPENPKPSPTPSPTASPISKLPPIEGMRFGYFYSDLSSLSIDNPDPEKLRNAELGEIQRLVNGSKKGNRNLSSLTTALELSGDYVNWMLTATFGASEEAVHDFSKQCVLKRVRVCFTLIEGGQDGPSWEATLRQAEPHLKIIDSYGALDSVYVADEPTSRGLTQKTLAERNEKIHKLGYKTFIAGSVAEATIRPPGTDLYAFSCYEPGFAIPRCGKYVRESENVNMLLAQSFMGGNRHAQGYIEKMPDQFAWLDVALDPDVRGRLEGMVFWLWPNFSAGRGYDYIGAAGDPATIAAHRTISTVLGIKK